MAKKIKITINPDYGALEEFIERIPVHGYSSSGVLREGRNRIDRVVAGGREMVVKRYKTPFWVSRVAYTFFCKTKARKAYEHALKLLAAGYHTAAPIAYIEEKRGGLFATGYFISEYLPLPLLDDFYTHDEPTRAALLRDFTDFTVRMHADGILHRDYNLSNVLYFREGARYVFSLIDINRMTFGRVSKRGVLKSLKTLTFKDWTAVEMIEGYAEARGWNPQLTASNVLRRKGLDPARRAKRFFRKLFGIKRK